MKIPDVRVRPFDLPHEEHAFHPTWEPMASRSHRLTLVEVHTDEGITGIGSGGVLTRLNTTPGLGGPPGPVDTALGDTAGKVAGLPLYKLLGGRHDRLPAYASTGELR